MNEYKKAIFEPAFSGHCPQCRMMGLDRPMWMNIEDNYECPDCQLLVQIESYATIILPFRGMGCFQLPVTQEHRAIPESPSVVPSRLARKSESGDVEYLDSPDKLLDYLEAID